MLSESVKDNVSSSRRCYCACPTVSLYIRRWTAYSACRW